MKESRHRARCTETASEGFLRQEGCGQGVRCEEDDSQTRRHALTLRVDVRMIGECLTVSSAEAGYRGDMVNAKPSLLPGLLFGLGLGGFVDGIVLHEILQWHHMISGAESSNTLAGLELNIVADGFFHVVTWLLVMAASIMTLVSWRKGRLAPTWSFHFGLLLAGWGIFNLVEGLIDHQLLGIHHVRDDLGGPVSWDIGFLLSGVVLTGAGLVLYRLGSRSLVASGP